MKALVIFHHVGVGRTGDTPGGTDRPARWSVPQGPVLFFDKPPSPITPIDERPEWHAEPLVQVARATIDELNAPAVEHLTLSSPAPAASIIETITKDRIDFLCVGTDVVGRFFNWLPTLKATARLRLFERLQEGARWNVDFILMIGLSTAIASLGLIQNSTAVVIGAMVVAPLMTPLIGSGLALVQGNLKFFRDDLKTMSLGAVVCLMISTLIGLTIPMEELTPELLARGGPTLLDLVTDLKRIVNDQIEQEVNVGVNVFQEAKIR